MDFLFLMLFNFNLTGLVIDVDSLLNLERLDAFCCFELAWITLVMADEIPKICNTSQFLRQLSSSS